jgi:hypothetical protein
MSVHRLLMIGLAVLGMLALPSACRFDPDLSRFDACGEDDSCPAGYTCLAEAQRCLPDCGAQGPCPIDPPADTDGGTDAGMGEDAGTDAGMDAGTGENSDGGTDGGTDAGEPLSLLTDALPVATETVLYSQVLQARGGTPPYTFQPQPEEPLPAWLTLSDGTLSGTPPGVGTFRVAVEVVDQGSPPARVGKAFSLRVRSVVRVGGPGTLVEGYSGNSYQEQISAHGGVPPYQFSLKPGNQLPTGLSLQSDGGVRGTPSGTGTKSFVVQVTDSDSMPQTVERGLDLPVVSAPLLGSKLSTRSLPDGRVGVPYHYVLRVSNNASVTWDLVSGDLPNGILLDQEEGILYGTPLEVSSKNVKLSATGGLGKVGEELFTLTVHP